MPSCTYLHPLRTIRVEWEVEDDGVPLLTSYADAAPGADTELESADVKIVHSDSVVLHRYPDDERDQSRVKFELESFLPELLTDEYQVKVMNCTGTSFDHQWTALLAIPNNTISDIECDLKAIALDGSGLFIGRRGQWWWSGAVNADGSNIHLDRFKHPESDAVEVKILEAIDEASNASGSAVRRLIIFGDFVTPATLKKIGAMTQGRFDSIDRLNPFHHVRSGLDRKYAKGLLRRAHLLGSFVGVIVDDQ